MEARMRRAIAAMAAVAAGLLIAGCSSAAATSQAPSTNGIGPITFAIGSDDIGWLGPVINAWNTAHPAQWVTPLYLPDASNVQLDQLVANLQAKSDVYDVIDMDVVWTAEFASNGWISQLSPQDFPLQDFFKSAVNTAKYQGRLYAVPDYTNADLLYYRTDILAKAGIRQPPTTWKQLQYLAETVAPKYGLQGYAATFAQYEGLTVDFASAVGSEGGSILNPAGTDVTVNSGSALHGLEFLVDGVKDHWIPQETLKYEEVSAQQAFEDGQFLFLDDWPDVYASAASQKTRGNKVYGKFGIALLPGPDGPGLSSLGGANLAISAYSQHPQTALRFIQYLTQVPQQETMFEQGDFPPVLESLYSDKSLIAQFPYLHTLENAIESAQPRPSITNYDQASLVISSDTYQALEGNKTPELALRDMQDQLTQILHDGLRTD
jgi:multiple sugar transport system substrate-binding protein